MARTTKTIYTCDLHEGDEVTQDVAEVSFAFDGSSYEIDLCPDHRVEMEEAFATYVGSARRASRSGTSAPRRTTRAAAGSGGGRASGGSDREEVQRIREWAREHGHKVSERGRLSSSVLEAYRAAQ
jgi:general stress protein YciG